MASSFPSGQQSQTSELPSLMNIVSDVNSNCLSSSQGSALSSQLNKTTSPSTTMTPHLPQTPSFHPINAALVPNNIENSVTATAQSSVSPVSGTPASNASQSGDTMVAPTTPVDDRKPLVGATPGSGFAPTNKVEKKYDPKDPNRPRRKKARRACYSCQRAHLTCADERPCARCVKRGISHSCQDGVRKKAKYLHDASPDQLTSVLGPSYNAVNSEVSVASSSHVEASGINNSLSDAASLANSALYSGGIPLYPNGTQADITDIGEGLSGFNVQTSPVSSTFQSPVTGENTHNNLASLGSLNATQSDAMNFSTLFDPSNPAFYSFEIENLENLNFGSTYGAIEFGILGHMSKTADNNRHNTLTDHTAINGSSRPPATSGAISSFNPFETSEPGNFPVFDNSMIDIATLDAQAASLNQGNLQHGLPHAYAISAGSNSLASPSTENTASPQPAVLGNFDNSPVATPGAFSGQNGAVKAAAGINSTTSALARPRPRPKLLKSGGLLGKRRRDSSHVYEAVKEPYPYINGFHKLLTFLRSRFPPDKTLKIAKSLASIRPSFISCTTSLNRRDLIFMEQCFQRTLFEYEEFMSHTSAPTIVCRRTGEVAAVNKEFTALTGWTKDILLGRAPNENVNTGVANRKANNSASANTTPVAGYVKPDILGRDETCQPVFIPELLDDESVVQFYEDYAHLAFGDSRGTINRRCRLLKYQKGGNEPTSTPSSQASAVQTSPAGRARGSVLSNRVIKIDSEHGISKIEKDGKVDCTYCWAIKRDVFDIPMLIVMNFLPCYNRKSEAMAV